MDIDIFSAKRIMDSLKRANNIREGDFKQVIVVNKGLNMSIGKTSAQVAHASVLSMLNSDSGIIAGWLDNSYVKIVLGADGAFDLLSLKEKCDEANIPCALVIDEGRTEISNGAITCLGIGPSTKDEIDKITGDLRLL